MAIELITGRYGTAHIGSEDVRAYQAYTAGSGRYILHGGGATIQSANDVHLNPAEILIDGAHVRITGLGEDVTLENGASSYNRVDIVALHYVMTGSGDSAVESVTLEVVKGTPSELTPSDPEMPASGSILDNVSETYVPYARVLIQGLTPQTPEMLLPDYVNPSDISGDGEQVDPSVLVNLSSRKADTVFKANPRPGITGILPASNGGTGKTSLQSARNAMGLGNTTGALPVVNGGTGATSGDSAMGALAPAVPALQSKVFPDMTVTATRRGNIVTLMVYQENISGDILTSGAWSNIAQLKSGCHPTDDVIVLCGTNASSGAWLQMRVTTTGAVQIRNMYGGDNATWSLLAATASFACEAA